MTLALPESLAPLEAAALLADFVDVLIPGDTTWPSASSIGVQGLVAVRLSEAAGEAEMPRLVALLLDAGAPFAGRSADLRRAIVERVEVMDPDGFERVRAAVFLAYYEHPVVMDVIRSLGRPYAMRPHLTGYPLRRFDPERDTPRHGRGSYVPTDAVRPVDIRGLGLSDRITTRWGLGR